jgi:hypothetical protein
MVMPDGSYDDAAIWADILGDDVLSTDTLLVDLRDAEWREEDHPRGEGGKFTDKGDSAGRDRKPGDGSTVRMADLLAAISRPDGGFTVQPLTGDAPSGPGHFAVSIARGREREFDVASLTTADIAGFVDDNLPSFEDPGVFLGGWHDPASHRAFLDISRVVTSAAEAERLARENDQIAYFDFGSGRSVDVGVRSAGQ